MQSSVMMRPRCRARFCNDHRRALRATGAVKFEVKLNVCRGKVWEPSAAPVAPGAARNRFRHNRPNLA
jgi:hypothetical protein